MTSQGVPGYARHTCDNMESQAPCGGIIVLDNTGRHVVVVETHPGQLGFTKGKRAKGETLRECAIRETAEECGLTWDQLAQIPLREPLIEYTDRGSLSVEYMLATALRGRGLRWPPNELAMVTWMPVEKAILHRKLRERRKRLLQAAVERFSTYMEEESKSVASKGC